MIGQKNREVSLLFRKVEAFALNLLHLIRGVRVYPAKHPTLLEVAKNALNSAPFDPQGSLTIGITSRELVVSGEFVAGKASSLASMLHARKVLQLLWTKDDSLTTWYHSCCEKIEKNEANKAKRRVIDGARCDGCI